ncbi:uncharacterized protein BX664DRAFT_45377 [Halteromyces radiatus]|uniref:uncharacterized protein n=1 Tax=Halteromyces radiatus TaxID=101107 RepID=UPI00221FDDEB|nr:uncharacterized protein BX664DRAFT_45377 [Halteromyces radiatus]KAI8077869.1 hypothetical protein BX664DRAFT_45377 [Halteromyces radiatus]
MQTTSILSKKEQHILDNQLEIDWLKRQIEQRKQRDLGTYSAIKEKIQNMTDEQVQEKLRAYPEHVAAIRVRMDIMAQYNLSKDRISENLDDSHYILDSLYPRDTLTDEPSDLLKLQVQDLVVYRDKLVVEKMQLLEQLNEIQNRLTYLSAQAIVKYQENGQLVMNLDRVKQQAVLEQQQIENGTPAQGSVTSSQPTQERAIEKLHDIKNRLEIAKNVLMGLILESSIDWASDRKWSRVMLQLGAEEEEEED